MKNAFLSKFFIVLLLFSSFPLFADLIKEGIAAPDFCVMSGDGQTLTLGQLRGKVVVMFYNSKDTTILDSKLRKALNKFYDEQPGDIKAKVFKLAIIDCSSAFFPIDLVWKQKLIEASKQKNIIIYGDWDGKVAEGYGFNTEQPNVVIIDKTGIIRFIDNKEITDEKDIRKVEDILKHLI